MIISSNYRCDDGCVVWNPISSCLKNSSYEKLKFFVTLRFKPIGFNGFADVSTLLEVPTKIFLETFQ